MRVWNRAIWAVIRSIENPPRCYNRTDRRKTRYVLDARYRF